MAAYASTVTVQLRKVIRLNDLVGMAIYAGKINITNYNSTTKPAITDISGKFKDVFAVVAGVSDNGHIFEWDLTNNTFKVWHGDYTNVADGPLVEAVTDTDVGEAQFIAIGLV